jgi:hypothetical protein
MPLPNLEKIIPQFDITIPSSEEVVKFRPFLVKEEKLLLLALEENDEKKMLDSVMNVISACALSTLKPENLSNFDIEYIFIQLRARSVNDQVELVYKCHNEITLTPEQVERRFRGRKVADGEVITGSCDNLVKIGIKLDDVKVQQNPEHTKRIFLTETLGLVMRYPNFKMAKQLAGKENKQTVLDVFKSIAQCVESVFDDEAVYSNFTIEEIQSWVEKLTQIQFAKIQQFFETMPKLAHDVDFKCSSCGYEEKIHLEGLASFFG